MSEDTHDWAGQWIYNDTTKSSGSFQPTHCKKCGMDFWQWHLSKEKLNCIQYKIKDILE